MHPPVAVCRVYFGSVFVPGVPASIGLGTGRFVLDENHEVTEFAEAVNFGVCRELAFTLSCRDFSHMLHFYAAIHKFLL